MSQIVFGVDFSDMTEAVISAAVQAGKQAGSPEFHAVCILEPSRNPVVAQEEHKHELEEVEKALKACVASITDAEVKCHVSVGNVAGEIAQVAMSVKAELIIIGRHGQSATQPLVIGSTPVRLLQLAQCSVLVVQPANYA